jgi:hypothetical protein
MTQPSPARDGLPDLLRRRIVVAPMAGYKTPEAMAAEITAVRAYAARPRR